MTAATGSVGDRDWLRLATLRNLLRDYPLIPLTVLLVLLIALVELVQPGTVNTGWAAFTVRQAVVLAIIAGCQALTMLTGGIDLSVAYVASMSGFVTATFVHQPGGWVLGIGVALAAAALAGRGSAEAEANLTELRERLINGILSTISPTPRILCQNSPRLPNTVAVELPASARQIQRVARPLAVASSQSHTPPDEMTRVLREVGCTDSQIGRTLRLSVGWTTTRDQIDRAIELLADACDKCLSH